MTVSRGIWIGLIGVVVGALLAWGATFFFKKQPVPSQVSAPPSQEASTSSQTEDSRAYLEVEGTQLSGTDQAGRKQWEVRAQTVSLDSRREVAILQNPVGTLYKDGKPAVNFRANRGQVNMETREAELTGDVRMESKDGRRLFAQKVSWSEKAGLVIASGGVRLTEGKVTVTADRLESDLDLTQTRLTGNVRVEQSE